MLEIDQGSRKRVVLTPSAPTKPDQSSGGGPAKLAARQPTPAPQVVSEHGEGGGSRPGDTGAKPTVRQTQNGYASPAATQPKPAAAPQLVSEHGQGGGSGSRATGTPPTAKETQTGYGAPGGARPAGVPTTPASSRSPSQKPLTATAQKSAKQPTYASPSRVSAGSKPLPVVTVCGPSTCVRVEGTIRVTSASTSVGSLSVDDKTISVRTGRGAEVTDPSALWSVVVSGLALQTGDPVRTRGQKSSRHEPIVEW